RRSPPPFPTRRSSDLTAGYAAWAWFVFALTSVFFVAADGAGRPVTELLDPDRFLNFVGAIEQPKAWLITAFVALLLALGCRLVLDRKSTRLNSSHVKI